MQTNRLRGIVAARADASHVQAIADLNKAFADFKASHEEALSKKADVLLTEKVDRVNAAVTELQAVVDQQNQRMASMSVSAGQDRVKDREYTDAFIAHVKKGDVQASLNKGTDADGGFLAPIEWDRTITDKLKLISPMRSICRVQAIGTNTFSKLFSDRATASGWVGETTARTETATGQFASLQFPTGEIYANAAATQQLLDDSLVDLESWIASEVQTEFAQEEGAAFISGNGTNKPHGLLTYVTGGTAAARHPWGAITLVNSGNASALTADGIVNLVYALPSAFTGNATMIMNRNTQGKVRLLKDGQNNYLWQPSYAAGQPATVLGYPVVEMPDMPDVAASAKSIVFGDFNAGYLIVDRTQVRVLRDPYTNKPYVMFYVTKRVGGGVLNPEAFKAQNVAA